MNSKEIDGGTARAYFLGLSGLFTDRSRNINAETDTVGFCLEVNYALKYFNDLFGDRLFFRAKKEGDDYYNFEQTRETLERRLDEISELADPDSLVVLAFSSHGNKDECGDAIFHLNENEKMTSRELYDLPSFQRLLSKDVGLLMFLGSCHSGAASNSMPENITLITATDEDSRGSGRTPVISSFVDSAKLSTYVLGEDFDAKRIFDRCVKNFTFKICDEQEYQFYGRNLRVELASDFAPQKRFDFFYSGCSKEKSLRTVTEKHKAVVVYLLKQRAEREDVIADSYKLAFALSGRETADDWKNEQVLAYAKKHYESGVGQENLTRYSDLINRTIHLKGNEMYRKLIESLKDPAFDQVFDYPFREVCDILYLMSTPMNYAELIELIKPTKRQQRESRYLVVEKHRNAERITELTYLNLTDAERNGTLEEINKRLILTLSNLQFALPVVYRFSRKSGSSNELIETMFKYGTESPVHDIYILNHDLRKGLSFTSLQKKITCLERVI